MKTILFKNGKEVKISKDFAKRISNSMINNGVNGVISSNDIDGFLVATINTADVSAIY